MIDSDKAKKSFELCLLREELLTEEQLLFHAQLGVRLDEPEAQLFAFACREGSASLTDAKAVSGGTGPEARKVLETLVVQGLLQPLKEGVLYGLAEHLKGRLDATKPDQLKGDQVAGRSGDLVTDQVVAPPQNLVTNRVIRTLTEHQRQIIDACDVPRSLADLMGRVGVTHRTFFRRKHLKPLLEAGIVSLTNPDNPSAANQRYVLTEAGVGLKAASIGKEPENEAHDQG